MGKIAMTGGKRVIREDPRHDNLALKLAEENTRHAVLAAYTGALKGLLRSGQRNRFIGNPVLVVMFRHHLCRSLVGLVWLVVVKPVLRSQGGCCNRPGLGVDIRANRQTTLAIA
jgi:hypothetical protein